MSAIQLTGSDRWEVLTPVSTGKEDQGVVHIPNSGIVTSNGQYVLPIGSLPSQPIYVTASGNEVAANGVSGIQYQVKKQTDTVDTVGVLFRSWSHSKLLILLPGHPTNPKCRWVTCRFLNAGIGWWHRAYPAPPWWQPGQHRYQLCYDGEHRPPDAGGASTVNPRRLTGWRVCVHRHGTRRAAQQYNICPYK